MNDYSFTNSDVLAVFDSYPDDIRATLMVLRALILDVASQTEGVGVLEETLRWGEPSYITSESKSGSLIRIHHCASKPFDFAMYFHCGTHLVETFRQEFPSELTFEGNRAITFMLGDELPLDALRQCIVMALTYNLKK